MKEKKKALLVATVQSHIAQFHRPLIKILKEKGYEIHVAARDNLAEKNGLIIHNVDKKFDLPFVRSPFNKKNVEVLKELKRIIDSGEYDIVSCNTPVGGLVTRVAARKARKTGSKVIYTAHGFHFYKGAPKKNWLIYYPIEKFMAHLTDVLITITKEDYELAKRKFKTEVRHIHGVGVDEKKYLSISEEDNEKFRERMGYDKRFVILCTGELNANKNQITVIRAIKQLVESYPEILLLLAGNGPKENELRKAISEMDLENNVKMLGYHTDLEKYVNACDLVVSASYREGLPLNIMEAMICGKAVIASSNRGHRELVDEGETGYLLEASDASAIAKKIELLLENSRTRNEIGQNAIQKVSLYTMKNVEQELKGIYGLNNE